MFSLGNLKGTIMYENIPLVKFEYDGGMFVDAELLCYDKTILPFDFVDFVVNEDRVTTFFEERVTPDTRINIDIELKKYGLYPYNPETLIRYQNGRCFDDDYWVKFD